MWRCDAAQNKRGEHNMHAQPARTRVSGLILSQIVTKSISYFTTALTFRRHARDSTPILLHPSPWLQLAFLHFSSCPIPSSNATLALQEEMHWKNVFWLYYSIMLTWLHNRVQLSISCILLRAGSTTSYYPWAHVINGLLWVLIMTFPGMVSVDTHRYSIVQ